MSVGAVVALLTCFFTTLAPNSVLASPHRRSHAATTAFKHSSPCPATGRSTGACPGYVIDHVIPLACGGPDSPGNMQWQTVADARAKDRWERKDCAPSYRP